MSSLTFSPSATITPPRKFSIDSPYIFTVKVRNFRNNASKIAPHVGPMGLSTRMVNQRMTEFLQGLKWQGKHVTLRIIIKQRDMIDFELVEHSPQLIISQLGAPYVDQYLISHNGNITHDQLLHIAQSKTHSKTAKTLTSKVKEVLGTCVSVGCRVNGEDPKVVLLQISNGMNPFKIQETIK